MSLPQKAQTILATAEQSLRTLLEEAARDGRYADVVQLAETAQTLRQLIESPAPPTPTDHQETLGSRPSTRSKSSKAIEYPKFEIDGDRLIKIGWSKREKAEYQHKAARDVALCTYLQLGRDRPTDPFRMEEQFPIRMADGSDVPTYQSYLVLAWLRYIGSIEKVGKDSYRWVDVDIDEASFKRAWESTSRIKFVD